MAGEKKEHFSPSSMVELAVSYHFCTIFRQEIDLPSFTVQELEQDVLDDNGLLGDILRSFVDHLFPRRKNDWFTKLQQLFPTFGEMDPRLEELVEDITCWNDIAPEAKILVFWALCEYTVEVSRACRDKCANHSNLNNVRLKPIGVAKPGTAYFSLGGIDMDLHNLAISNFATDLESERSGRLYAAVKRSKSGEPPQSQWEPVASSLEEFEHFSQTLPRKDKLREQIETELEKQRENQKKWERRQNATKRAGLDLANVIDISSSRASRARKPVKYTDEFEYDFDLSEDEKSVTKPVPEPPKEAVPIVSVSSRGRIRTLHQRGWQSVSGDDDNKSWKRKLSSSPEADETSDEESDCIQREVMEGPGTDEESSDSSSVDMFKGPKFQSLLQFKGA